jgi:hypothetical protein
MIEIGQRVDFPEWRNSGRENEGSLSGDHGLTCNRGLTFASTPEEYGGGGQAARENNKPQRKEGDWISCRLLPEAFALFCFVAALVRSLLTLALFHFGRRVGRLPTKYANPKDRSYEGSKDNFSIQ